MVVLIIGSIRMPAKELIEDSRTVENNLYTEKKDSINRREN